MARGRKTKSRSSRRVNPGMRSGSPKKGARNKYYLGGQMY